MNGGRDHPSLVGRTLDNGRSKVAAA